MMGAAYFVFFLQVAAIGSLADEVCGSIGCADDASVLLQHKISEESALTGDYQQIQARLEELEQEQKKLMDTLLQQDQSSKDEVGSGGPCSVDPTAYENSASYTSMVDLKGKKGVGDGKLEALVGDKVQGCVAKGKLIPFGPNAGKFIYLLMVYGKGQGDDGVPDSNKPVIFKYTNKDGTFMLFPEEPTTFKPEGITGDVLKPVELKELNPAKFENTMTETTAVKVKDELKSDGLLLAYSAGEIVGVSKSQAVPPIPTVFGQYAGKVEQAITIYGNGAGKKITFKYVPSTGDMLTVAPDVEQTFKSNDNLGTAKEPVVMSDTPAAPPSCVPKPDVPQKVFDAWTVKQGWGKGYTCEMFAKFSMCVHLKDGNVCDTTCDIGCPKK